MLQCRVHGLVLSFLPRNPHPRLQCHVCHTPSDLSEARSRPRPFPRLTWEPGLPGDCLKVEWSLQCDGSARHAVEGNLDSAVELAVCMCAEGHYDRARALVHPAASHFLPIRLNKVHL